MAYNVDAIAREFCIRSGWVATNLSAQKLVYLAHMLYAGRCNGERLVIEDFEAWDYGPVVPSFYHRVKAFGSSPIRDIFWTVPKITDGRAISVIDEVWGALGTATPGQLVAVTHDEKGAWHKTYKPGAKGIVIPQSEIIQEYNRRVG